LSSFPFVVFPERDDIWDLGQVQRDEVSGEGSRDASAIKKSPSQRVGFFFWGGLLAIVPFLADQEPVGTGFQVLQSPPFAVN